MMDRLRKLFSKKYRDSILAIYPIFLLIKNLIQKIKKLALSPRLMLKLVTPIIFALSPSYAFATHVPNAPFAGHVAGALSWAGYASAALILGTINTVLFAIYTFLQWIASWMLILSEFAILESVRAISDIRIVETGWTLVRDFANLFFIFILLVIAIATILRIESYGMKHLLPTLIIIAIFINFSLLLTQFIIQPTNYMALWFMDMIKGSNDTFALSVAQALHISAFSNTAPPKEESWFRKNVKGIFKDEIEFYNTIIKPQNKFQQNLGEFIVLLFGVMLFLMMAFIAIAIAILATIRTIVLMFLIILSPLAFLFHVLPATKGYASQWWNKLISQAIFLPVMLFFIWLGVELSKDLPEHFGIKESMLNSNPLYDLSFLYLIILVMMFLGGGLIAAQRLGAVGAGTAISWGRRLGYGALGAVGGVTAYYTYRQVAHRAAESETMEKLSTQKWVGSMFGAARQKLEGYGKPLKEVEMRQERYRRAYEEKHPEKKVENFLNMNEAKQEAYLRDKETNLASFAKAMHDLPDANVEDKVRKLEAQAQARKALEKDPDKLEKFDRTIQSQIAKDEGTLKKAAESHAYNPKIMEGAIKMAKKDALKEGWEEKDIGMFLTKFNDMPDDIAKAFIETGKDEDMQKKIKAISDPAEQEAFVKRIAGLDKTKANAVLKVAPRFAADFGKTLQEAIRLIDFKEISKGEASVVKNEIVLHTTSEQREKILARGDEVATDYLKGIEALDPIGHFASNVADEIEKRGGNKAAANQIRNNPIMQGSHNLNA